MALESGAKIGSWTLEAELGRGAMAVVYRARNAELGTLAALKVLERSDPDTEARLLAEGRAQAALEHPGVIGVRDVIRTPDGRAVLVMELVPGDDLSRVLTEGLLPLARALALFRQILGAVEAAHDRGLVHRDLKPGNVLVDRGGEPWVAKVGDFGLVKEPGSDATVPPDQWSTCVLEVQGALRGERRATPDEFGWMSVIGLAPGLYRAEVRCGETRHSEVIDVERDRVTLEVPEPTP